MPTRECTFEVTSQMTLEYTDGAATSVLKSSSVNLKPLKPLDRGMYLDGGGLPRKDAMKPITNTLIASLIIHVRACAKKGWMSEGEHMQYITQQIQGIFVQPGDIVKGTFNEG